MRQYLPADPWHRVVIHNIPLHDFQEGPKESWCKQNGNSIVFYHITLPTRHLVSIDHLADWRDIYRAHAF